MKKFFFLAAAALATLTLNAQYALNNPVGEDGRYIVKWDCAKGTFAESNDFAADETFTLAVDVTGTNYESALKEAPNGGTRSMAANIWTNYGPKKDDTNRLKQIKGNIYGATFNLKECVTDLNAEEGAKIMKDSIVYAYCQLFMFAYGEVGGKMEPGIEWYVDAQPIQADGSDCFFATQPAKGVEPEEFYSDEVGDGMFTMKVVGYATPCGLEEEPQAIENVTLAPKAQKVIENGQIVLINNGVRYNALGSVIE